MQTRLIEIVPDEIASEESWSDWATRNVKENGWKVAGAAVVVAPVIPVGLGAIAVTAGLVSGVQNGVAWLKGVDSIDKVQLAGARHLTDEHGMPVQVNQFYAVHPDESRSHIVILASEFHNVIVREQIADLVSFIRASVRATSITVEVESERSGKFGGGFFSKFTVKTEGGVAKHHSVELSYDDPEFVILDYVPFWLRTFPEIVAAFKGAKRGSLKRSLSVDTTFGLNASLADQAGIDVSWLGKQKFNVFVKFA